MFIPQCLGTNAHPYLRISYGVNFSLAEIEMRAAAGGADQCNGGTASASSTYAGTSAAGAFANDNNATVWTGIAGAGFYWIKYAFLTPVSVAQLWIYPANFGVGVVQIPGFSLEYSDDNSTWFTAASFSGLSWVNATPQTFTIP
jgi:hypothetical protein